MQQRGEEDDGGEHQPVVCGFQQRVTQPQVHEPALDGDIVEEVNVAHAGGV